MANFIFFDGHVKSKKWLSTLRPLTENNWLLSPNPDPSNTRILGAPGCDSKVPAPEAPLWKGKECAPRQ